VHRAAVRPVLRFAPTRIGRSAQGEHIHKGGLTMQAALGFWRQVLLFMELPSIARAHVMRWPQRKTNTARADLGK